MARVRPVRGLRYDLRRAGDAGNGHREGRVVRVCFDIDRVEGISIQSQGTEAGSGNDHVQVIVIDILFAGSVKEYIFFTLLHRA